MLAELALMVTEIKEELRTIDVQPGELSQTNLPEAAATHQGLLDAKQQTLDEWVKCAEIVQDRIKFIEGRNTLEDYREIVPLVAQLDAWAQDEALKAEGNTAKRLEDIARSADEIKNKVRSQLVGDREARAREYMALADQAIDQPFVRVWPLLRAKLMWCEVARIVAGIEPEPSELKSVQEQLDKLNSTILYEMSDVRDKETQQLAKEQEVRWLQATKDSDDKVVKETFSELKRILAFSPQISVDHEFLDAYWEREYAVISVKISESRVRGLLQRSLDQSLSIPRAWMELQEAQQLARTLGPEINAAVGSAKKALTTRTTEQLNAHSREFDDHIEHKFFEGAKHVLNQMSALMPYVGADENDTWTQRFSEAQEKYDISISPSSGTPELKEFLDYLNEVNAASNKLDALNQIEHFRSRIPKELSKAPANIRSEIVDAISRVLKSLPTGDMQGFDAMRKNYLEQIKRNFDESLQVS